MQTITLKIKLSDQALANLKRLAALDKVSVTELIRRTIEGTPAKQPPALSAGPTRSIDRDG